MMNEGDTFPPFSLPDQSGNIVTRDRFLGAPVVIYFYPKDDTPGCTAEACAFQESMPDFGDVKVVGVSPDDAGSHRKFAEKFNLKFTLLADEGHHLCDKVGVWVSKSMYGKEYMGVERTTFLLDAEARILKIWRKVKVPNHAVEVLAAIESQGQ
jgi:peroxiredoxin Q/BCP